MSTEKKTQAELEAERIAAEAAKKVVFTDEQQAKVNELIQGAMGRAGKEARETAVRLEGELTAARNDLAAAKAELAKATTPASKKAAEGDVAALQATIEEMKRATSNHATELQRLSDAAKAKDAEASEARKETINVRKQVAIANAASKVNFVNVEVVAKLTSDSIHYDADKKKFVVLGENGQERMNSAFDPMTLDEFYTEFAAKNPYLVRGDVKGGVGSTENKRFDTTANGKYEVKQIFGKDSDSRLAMELKRENPAEYARLRKIAVEGRLIAG